MRSTSLLLLLLGAGCFSTGGGSPRDDHDLASPGSPPDLASLDDFGEMQVADLKKKQPKDLAQAADFIAPSDHDLGSPVIVSFAIQQTSVSNGDVVVIDATVSHPNGSSEIAGLELRSVPAAGEASFASYGAVPLATGSGNQTVFHRSLTWAEIDAGHALEFHTATTRSFYVVASDSAGHTVESSAIEVGFACAYNVYACHGSCGGCGNYLACSHDWASQSTCSQICASYGETCTSCGEGRFVSICDWETGKASFYVTGNGCDTALSTWGYYQLSTNGVSCCCH